MTRWIEGTISSLRCEGSGHITPHLTFSGDTDMATAGLASLTSVVVNEVVVAQLIDGEFEDSAGEALQTRVNDLLARDDLRAVQLRRVEEGAVTKVTSFQEFCRACTPPRLIFKCPQCGSDAVAYRFETPTQFKRDGGTLTIVADIELRDGS